MKLLIKLTPLEPYFLGDDRSFQYGELKIQRAAGYISHSRITPSQTTLFGVLRYLGIKTPDPDFKLDCQDIENIGKSSFNLPKPNADGFGRIISVSPLYLYDNNGQYYVRTPFDHNNKGNYTSYEPWEKYTEFIPTGCGQRIFPEDYDEKSGLEDSWTCLKDLSLHSKLFKRVMQVGHEKKGVSEAFYKKERVVIHKDFSFAFIAEVKDGFYKEPAETDPKSPEKRVVYLGQDKSTFLAEIITDFTEPSFCLLRNQIKTNTVYALSDIYIQPEVKITKGETVNSNNENEKDKMRKLYSLCNFVCAQSIDFRVFRTDYSLKLPHGKRFIKEPELIRLIAAGSVFIVNDLNRFKELCHNEHAEKAGFNQLLEGSRK